MEDKILKTEDRILKVNIKKAREWYKSHFTALKEIALQLYSEKELEENIIPNSWEEYKAHYKISSEYNAILNSQTIPNKYKVLAKLELLRNCYRQGWEPDWNTHASKYCIVCYEGYIIQDDTVTETRHFLSFETKELRDKFYHNFVDLIKEAQDLI